MAGPMDEDPDRRYFADLLKAWREARGLSRDDLGAASGFSGATIKAFETCQRAVTVYHARLFDKAMNLDRIMERTAERFDRNAYSATMETFLAGEQDADELYSFEHSLIPGLLQTEAYAQAILSTWPNVTPHEVERLVAARMARQRVITREDRKPPYLWALIDQGALERPVAPALVLYEQCTHLVQMSMLPNVSISVVPYKAGGHTGLLGAFVIAERHGQDSMVYTEDIADGSVSEDPAVVADVALRFKSLQVEALPKGDSRDLIAEVAERRWKTAPPAGARALTAVTTEGTA